MATTSNKAITAEELNSKKGLKELFNTRDGERSSQLAKFRDCSALTIPSILPPLGFTESTDLNDVYNSFGARACNNLSNKLLLGLLPPNSSFFRLQPGEKLLDAMDSTDDQQSDTDTQLEAKLSELENRVMKKIELSGMRPVIHQAFLNLVVVGNALLLYDNNTMILYKVDSYVVSRDYTGKLLDVILKEKINYHSLPEDLQNKLNLTDEEQQKDIDLYTRYYRLSEKQWLTYQTVNNEIVDGSEKTIKDKHLPIMVLRWSKINGENYGRGLVEMHLGDFRSLEAITQMILEYSAVAAKVVFGISPGSVIEIDELEEAENGGVIIGNLERDVTRLSVDKQADLQIPMSVSQEITRRLGAAFLLQSTVTRDSERTTISGRQNNLNNLGFSRENQKEA